MMATALLSEPEKPQHDSAGVATVLLVGNPNAGKTALFNALTGLRAKTANYPGITVDLREGRLRLSDRPAKLVDLPGLYSLDAITPEEKLAKSALGGRVKDRPPDAVVLVVDATNVERNLFLASEVLDLGLPTVIALNLFDAARTAGITIDVDQLASKLDCPVVPVSSRTGEGLVRLRETLASLLAPEQLPVISQGSGSCTAGCSACPFAARYEWAEKIAGQTVHAPQSHGSTTAKIDRILTKPLVGIAAFLTVMLAVFYMIFSLAEVPMTMIEEGFVWAGQAVRVLLPAGTGGGLLWTGGVFGFALLLFALAYRVGRTRLTRTSVVVTVCGAVLVALMQPDDVRSLLVDGVIGGVGGVLVFLPQICILFFFISLLEDSGYLARAAFVMERVMRSVGLPGKAFVPMLSAHACAIPGIMAARVIENWRDRLVTILVLPLLTCSARLPVYAMVAALLFGSSPLKAAAVFFGAYLLGIVAALFTAFFLKKSILRGETAQLVLELPPYRLPSLRNALLAMFDRATVFVRQAGTIILFISVILWAMATFPKMPESELSPRVAQQFKSLNSDAAKLDGDAAKSLLAEADQLIAREKLAYSFAGRLGRAAEPVFSPLGFDWQINVGVISSFAAREVIVSTLAIIYGMGEDAADDQATLSETLRRQQRSDGTPVFTTATSLSLLVFYVLAMQCLPTQVVTRRETGSWKWAILQFGYMTVLAYVAAFIAYQTLAMLGAG